MRDFRDAKSMAQTLREALKAKSVSITHSESIELIAKTLGFHDWNELAAKIAVSRPAVAEWAPATTTVPLSPFAQVGIPILPLRDIVLFPEMVCPIFVGRYKTRRAIDSAMGRDGLVLAITQRHAGDDDPSLKALYSMGVTARIINRQTLVDGTLQLHVSGLERATVKKLKNDEILAAEIVTVKQTRTDVSEAVALSRAVLEAYQVCFDVDLSSVRDPQGMLRLPQSSNPGVLADSIAPMLPIEIGKRQQILEASDVVTRLEMILELMAGGKAA
jgi:ATP-dependent Lon protease